MITTRTLDNGIRLVMEVMPQVKSTTVGVWVHTGAVNEDPKYSGISHFVEHMMFKGTPTRSARKISEDVEAIGGQMNAFTGKEATCYYVKSLTENWKEAADVIVDMLENSLFAKEELDKERMVVCEEIKMYHDEADDVAHENLTNLLFKGEPLSKSVLGTPTNLKRITHNVMAQYVQENYVRESMVVSAAGSFDPDEMASYFEKCFMNRNASKPELPQVKPNYTPGYRSAKKDIVQAHLCLGTKAIPLTDDRSYSYQILNNIMGGGMSSRLFQNIREEQGLAYTVFSSMGTYSTDGYYEIYAGIAQDKLKQTIDAIKDELSLLSRESVLEKELESSRAQMKAGYAFSGESTSARMVNNGKNYLLLNRVFQAEEVMQGFDSVTIDSIDEIKKTVCDFSQYSASVVSGTNVDIKRLMK